MSLCKGNTRGKVCPDDLITHALCNRLTYQALHDVWQKDAASIRVLMTIKCQLITILY